MNEYVVCVLDLPRQRSTLCIPAAPPTAPMPTNSVQNIRMRRAVLYLDLIKASPYAYCSDLQYGTMMHQNSIYYLSSSPPSRGTYEPIARPTHIPSEIPKTHVVAEAASDQNTEAHADAHTLGAVVAGFLAFLLLAVCAFCKEYRKRKADDEPRQGGKGKSRILFIAASPITVYVFEKQKIYQHGGYDEVMKPHAFKQNEA